MLREWLGPTSLADFLATQHGRSPRAGAGTARAAIPMFGWDTLDGVLESAPPADVLIVAKGKEVDAPMPRSVRELRQLMARGVGVVIRRGENHHQDLRRVADAFAADLAGRIHIQLFVTPGGTHGFGWHYDIEDVYIAQTVGSKDYYFRENTVSRSTPHDGRFDFTTYKDETSQLATARLLAGDWLYLPSRWWHMAVCVEDALSISVGVLR